jgi:hypothetical protein
MLRSRLAVNIGLRVLIGISLSRPAAHYRRRTRRKANRPDIGLTEPIMSDLSNLGEGVGRLVISQCQPMGNGSEVDGLLYWVTHRVLGRNLPFPVWTKSSTLELEESLVCKILITFGLITKMLSILGHLSFRERKLRGRCLISTSSVSPWEECL